MDRLPAGDERAAGSQTNVVPVVRLDGTEQAESVGGNEANTSEEEIVVDTHPKQSRRAWNVERSEECNEPATESEQHGGTWREPIRRADKRIDIDTEVNPRTYVIIARRRQLLHYRPFLHQL